MESLRNFKIVLQLKLRERRVHNATSLCKLFYHDDRWLCKSVEKSVFDSEGEEVLLILDGFDEMPSSIVSNKHSLIMRLIRGQCLPRATLLVTSRPSALYQWAAVFLNNIGM